MAGMTAEEIRKLTDFDPWYLRQMEDLFQTENWLKGLSGVSDLDKQDWLEVKRRGFSDIQVARALKITEGEVRKARIGHDVRASMKRVDTCAAEFEAETPYMYSSYDGNDEVAPTDAKKILILGGGPNRIGQGIEFDYCCVHAAFALKDAGYETIMLNSNPETVSTDYDTSDRLYFEPLTVEDVLNVVESERPRHHRAVRRSTPLSLATRLEKALKDDPIPTASGNGNCKILYPLTALTPRRIARGGSDSRGARHSPAPRRRRARGGGAVAANNIGYPVMVRPSFVLGGRAMEIVSSDTDLKRYITTAVEVDPEKPVLVDKYLNNATELDVDALCDAEGNVVIAGIMEHIEQAGVLGDSACSIPSQTISESSLATIREWTPKVAKRLGVVGP